MGTKTNKSGRYYRGQHEQSIIAKRQRAKGKPRKTSVVSPAKDRQVKAVQPVKSGYSYLGDAKTSKPNKTVKIKGHKRLARTGKGGLDYEIVDVKAHDRHIHSQAKPSKKAKPKAKPVPQRVKFKGHYYKRVDVGMTTEGQVNVAKKVWLNKGYNVITRQFKGKTWLYARKPTLRKEQPKTSKPKARVSDRGFTWIPPSQLKADRVKKFNGEQYFLDGGSDKKTEAEAHAKRLKSLEWETGQKKWKVRLIKGGKDAGANWLVYHQRQEYKPPKASKTAPKSKSPSKPSTPRKSKSKAKGGSKRASPKSFNGLKVATPKTKLKSKAVKKAQAKPVSAPLRVKVGGKSYQRQIAQGYSLKADAVGKSKTFTGHSTVIRKFGDLYYIYGRTKT